MWLNPQPAARNVVHTPTAIALKMVMVVSRLGVRLVPVPFPRHCDRSDSSIGYQTFNDSVHRS